MNPNESARNASEATLESWKEIAAYLQRNAVTVRRWEKDEGLPVHRHSHKRGSSVYAYPSEIDAWRAGRKVAVEPVVRVFWRWPALAATMLLCLVMVGNGVRPVAAQQASATARQLWLTGDEDPCCTAPSADGRYIAYTDWSTGDLGVRDLVSGTSRLLTNRSGHDFAEPRKAISPDGRMIAYCGFGTASGGLRNNLESVRCLASANSHFRTPVLREADYSSNWFRRCRASVNGVCRE